MEDLSDWNVRQEHGGDVQSHVFNQDISGWNVGAVTSMYHKCHVF